MPVNPHYCQDSRRGRGRFEPITTAGTTVHEFIKGFSTHQVRRFDLYEWQLGEVLTADGYITPIQLKEALDRQQSEPSKCLGDILIEMGAISEKNLQLALSRNLGLPFIELIGFEADPAVIDPVSMDIAHKHSLMPLMYPHRTQRKRRDTGARYAGRPQDTQADRLQ